jgi:hypothetical protein
VKSLLPSVLLPVIWYVVPSSPIIMIPPSTSQPLFLVSLFPHSQAPVFFSVGWSLYFSLSHCFVSLSSILQLLFPQIILAFLFK